MIFLFLLSSIHATANCHEMTMPTSYNTFTNNYGYGLFGLGPNNAGFDGFGFWRDKFQNSGLPPLYTWQSHRNYYGEFAVHKNRYGNQAPVSLEELRQERYGPFYNGVWGFKNHSPYWFG